VQGTVGFAYPGLRTGRWSHPLDLGGWMHVDDGDPRTPAPARGRERVGPWVISGRPAHGLYERPHVSGLVDWSAAYNGWMLWRWRGLRMRWRSPLVSLWNPILAQQLVLDELGWSGVYWPDDADDWTADALLGHRKAGGGVRLRPRRRMRAWIAEARAAGLAVVRIPYSFGAVTAAQEGTLGSNFDLPGLAAEYARVLPGGIGEEAARDVLRHADVPLITAALDHEEYPLPVCGLALGYPPEVTAGVLARGAVHAFHALEAAEFGAYCPTCERRGDLARVPAVAAGGPSGALETRAGRVGSAAFGVPRAVRPTDGGLGEEVGR
jgi:hypothetical protein